jgi:ferredoxin-NADP reductase
MRGDEPAETEVDVRVARKEQLADGVVRLVLTDPSGAELPAWEPGSHVDLRLGDDMVRQYSLCGDRRDRSELAVAVLREAESRGGSAYVHDKLDEQDVVRLCGPRNNFPLVCAGRYLLIAGGIGITPIVPMLERLEENGADWRLVYGGRSRASMAFRDELVTRYGERVSIQPQDEIGLLDLDAELGSPDQETAVYCCGPEPLLEAVEKRCADWPTGSLHVERFSPKDYGEPTADSFEVELARSGRTLTVPAGQSIVDTLEDAGIEVEVSCLEGTCGTCETAVLDGEPEHRDSILTDEEKAQNDTMFVCVSRSCSERLKLDR